MTKSKQPKEQTTRLTAFRMPLSIYNNIKGGNLSQKIIKALEDYVAENPNNK